MGKRILEGSRRLAGPLVRRFYLPLARMRADWRQSIGPVALGRLQEAGFRFR
jgi:hypothetical protein